MDLFLALILCHNVTPVITAIEPESKKDKDFIEQAEYDSEGNDQQPQTFKKEFQASSPDEIALVKFAERLNMTLEERDE